MAEVNRQRNILRQARSIRGARETQEANAIVEAMSGDLERRRRVYSAPPSAYAPEDRGPQRSRVMQPKEIARITPIIRHLYTDLGWSVLDISVHPDVNRSTGIVTNIIKENEFVKGKKVTT